MGKADRNRRQSAREKIAAQRAAARRAERRRQVYLTGGSILAVIAIGGSVCTAAGVSAAEGSL
jgi:hypothetical protein